MWLIAKKEFNQYFSSLSGYLVVSIILIFAGFYLWVFSGNVFEYGYANLDVFFNIMPWLAIFFIPAITMRSFSDELSTGTIESLLTKPLKDRDIVAGKFLGALSVWTIIILSSLIYVVCISILATPTTPPDMGAIAGSYIGLFMLGALFISMGLLASIYSTNAIVGFVLGVILSYLAYDALYQLADLNLMGGQINYLLEYMGIRYHYDSMSRGVLDLGDVIYFLSSTLFFLFLTQLKLEKRKW